MNWSKVKSIFIFLFILVNIFLIWNIFYAADKSGRLDRETIDAGIAILDKKGISVEPQIIPSGVKSMNMLELYNPLSDQIKLADLLAGPNSVAEYGEEEGVVYESAKGRLAFFESRFEWIPAYPGKAIDDALPGSKAASKVSEFIKKSGISVKNLKWRGSMDVGNELFQIQYYQTYKDFEFFDTRLTAFVEKDGVKRVRGKWFEVNTVMQMKGSMRNAVSILLGFAADREGDNEDQRIVINSMEQGYFVEQAGKEYKILPAIPCWKITLKNGEVFYYDAVSGESLGK